MKKPKPKHSFVMLVDDNVIDNFINQKMIEGCNFAENLLIHTSGKGALEFLKNMERIHDSSKRSTPEIIFLDINMPILDGFQFVEEFEKLDKNFIADIKIILLTSSINPEDEEKSKKYSSIKGYIIKPLSQNALNAM
jgi:CheY-like chemotaxis protein